MSTRRLKKVAAYAVCRDGDRILMARYVSPDGSQRHWTLPGGSVEHAEDPYDAVVREVDEETGYQVEVECLLGVDSRVWHVDDGGAPGGAELHGFGIFYGVRIVGGQLRHETGGSTDQAAWISQVDVKGLARSTLVDVGLGLDGTRPRTGHVEPVPVGGLLRP